MQTYGNFSMLHTFHGVESCWIQIQLHGLTQSAWQFPTVPQDLHCFCKSTVPAKISLKNQPIIWSCKVSPSSTLSIALHGPVNLDRHCAACAESQTLKLDKHKTTTMCLCLLRSKGQHVGSQNSNEIPDTSALHHSASLYKRKRGIAQFPDGRMCFGESDITVTVTPFRFSPWGDKPISPPTSRKEIVYVICVTRLSYKTVVQEWFTRVSQKGVPQHCPMRDCKRVSTNATRDARVLNIHVCMWVRGFYVFLPGSYKRMHLLIGSLRLKRTNQDQTIEGPEKHREGNPKRSSAVFKFIRRLNKSATSEQNQ